MILEPNYIDSLFPASFFQVGNSLIGFSSNSLVFCERKLLFCHERPERIAHGLSFVKSDESESLKLLKLLFKKSAYERRVNERRERFALWHKKGKNCQKHTKNTKNTNF